MARTINEGFDTFLSWLVPLRTEHNLAESHNDSVKRCLVNNFECYNFFETGSFGSGTGIRHYSDTDYFAAIPSSKLKDNSSTSLREIKEELQGTFPRTSGIKVSCPAVNLPFGNYASETLEVTPACYRENSMFDGKSFPTYYIPDCNSGWMSSSPGAHNYYVKREDDRLSKKAKNLIQLVKAWKYYNSVPIRSFFLELYVTRYCVSETAIVYSIDLKNIFNKLAKDELPGMYDPTGISGLIKPCATDASHETALSKVKTAASRAQRANDFTHTDKFAEAFEMYDLLFNGKFPAR